MALGRESSLRGFRRSTAKLLFTWSTSLLLAASFSGHVHALPNEPAPVTVIGEPAFFSCNITAYVRAPDLQTGLRAFGEARLVAEGPSCEEITSWDVFLSMRERSVVRLPKSEEDLPKAPVYNETLQEEYYNNRSSIGNENWQDIFSFGNEIWDGIREMSPYDRELRAYKSLMKNASVWDVYSAERTVFETSARMWEAKDQSPLVPSGVVRQFGIAVPDCNFPPSSRQIHVDSGKAVEAVIFENEIKYSFRLGLRNSSIIDVPAGTTVFDTQIHPPLEHDKSVLPIKAKVPLLREVLERWDRPFFSQLMWGPINEQQDAQPPSYELDIEAPPFLIQGRNASLNISIRVLEQKEEVVPVKLAISAHTLASFTWAAGHAASAEAHERILWLGSEAGLFERHRSVKQHRARTVTAKDFDKQAAFSSDVQYFSSYGQPPASAHDIEGYSEPGHEFQLQVKVPDDILPTHETTFVKFVSFLSFDLYAVNITSGKLEEEHDDEQTWSSHPITNEKQHTRFSGRLKIPVYSNDGSSQAASTPSYLHRDCLAPKLLDRPALIGDAISFTPLSLATQNESEADRLLSRKYATRPCEDRYMRCGTRYEMVGDVWAMKQYREAVKEKSRQRERKQLVLQQPVVDHFGKRSSCDPRSEMVIAKSGL